jgi:high-affinity iron transporter
MLQPLLVTFREGLESFLIVGVIVGYLRKTDRAGLIRGVQIGLGISVVACLVGAWWLWTEIPNQPLYEGLAALTAAVLVGALLVQMMRMGRHMKREIETRVSRAAGAGTGVSARALAGVAAATMLLVTREGLEAVFYLRVQAMAARAAEVPLRGAMTVAGAILGLVLAALLSWYWGRYSNRVNLGVVLKVTALFLGLFLVQLLVYGVHELAESGVIHGSQGFHDATEMFGPDGGIGHFISYSLLAAPLIYLVWSRLAARPPRTSAPA